MPSGYRRYGLAGWGSTNAPTFVDTCGRLVMLFWLS